MTDAELLAAIEAAELTAIGPMHSDVAADRSDAIDRYLGKEYGDEQKGRSSVVSRDVSDVVEGVLSNVLKPFVSGDQVVQFDPRGPEDVEAAQQETDYVNFVALERNNGFLVLNSAVKDALLLRAGYIKCCWTTRSDVVLETYQGLSDEELTILAQDKEVEVVSHSEYPDPLFAQPPMMMPGAPMPPAPMLHDVKVRRAQPVEFVSMDPAPPDEILVSDRVRGPSLQDADFVQHRTRTTLSELRQMGYEVDDDVLDGDEGITNEEMARTRFGTTSWWDDEGLNDPARRLVLFKETWIRSDYDGDGIAELRRVCSVGQMMLANEEADIVPIACFSAVLMPHKHLGLSVYDLVADLAKLKTALLRQFMDNKYLANNSRVVVNPDIVNVDDLLTSRPGGVIRINSGLPQEAVIPLVTPDTGASALQGLEYLDSVRENRTGYTRYAQGMDSESLVNKTATGLMQATSQSQMRLEMISRTIAETGMRDLFRIIHALTLKHSTRAEKIRLRNQWVDVNPREWVRRTDLSISVGLGSTSQTQMLQNLMLLAQAQEKAMPMGLVRPDNVYNLLKKLSNAAGFKNPDEFFVEPPKQPKMGPNGPVIGKDGKPEMESQMPPPQKDPTVQAAEANGQALVQVENVKQQGVAQKTQVDAQVEMAKAKLDDDFRRWQTLMQEGTRMMIEAQRGHIQEQQLAIDVKSQEHQQRVAEHENNVKALHGALDAGAMRANVDVSPIADAIQRLAAAIAAPRELVRDQKTGRAVGSRSVQ